MVCHHCEALAKKHGKDRKGLQRFRCAPCNRTFTEYQDKPLEGMYLPLDKATLVLNMLLEGMSLRAVSRLTGVEMHNFVRPHKSLNGATPAMAQGIAKSFWTVEDLLRY